MFKKIEPGDLLYLHEGITILVVMVGGNGIRYMEPMNPKIDDDGNIESIFIPYEKFSEWAVSLGSVDNISAKLMGK